MGFLCRLAASSVSLLSLADSADDDLSDFPRASNVTFCDPSVALVFAVAKRGGRFRELLLLRLDLAVELGQFDLFHKAEVIVTKPPLRRPIFPVHAEQFPVPENYFPVPILREFYRNALTLRAFPTWSCEKTAEKQKIPCSFPCYQGISPSRAVRQNCVVSQ